MPDSPRIGPVVYDLYEPSTLVWQYVVADPASRRCLIIDPILESAPQRPDSYGTSAADAILDLVRSKNYKVDCLLATYASDGLRSAVWYLRMQLLITQSFAPQICGTQVVSRFANRFEKKYGTRDGFSTAFVENIEDGMTMRVGSLQVRVLHLPGLSTNNFGYLIGSNLFGALSICRAAQSTLQCPIATSDDCQLAASLKRILSLPSHFRILPDQGQQYDPVKSPSITVAECIATGSQTKALEARP